MDSSSDSNTVLVPGTRGPGGACRKDPIAPTK
eukprot:SAG31_NODE_32636_length_353_cov_0.834646_1_plen_31_part_01